MMITGVKYTDFCLYLVTCICRVLCIYISSWAVLFHTEHQVPHCLIERDIIPNKSKSHINVASVLLHAEKKM